MKVQKRNPNTVCLECKSPIYRRPCEIASGRVFCSHKCHMSNRTIYSNCKHCEKRYRPSSPESVFCSVSCSNRARTGIRYYNTDGKDIKTIKKDLVRERGGKCEECSFSVTSILQVHHIVEKANGGTDDFSNSKLLCPNCHCLKHYGKHGE